jgi:hypothetical protein
VSDPLDVRRRRVLVTFRATESDALYPYEVEGLGSDRVLSMYAWALHGRAGKEDVDFQNPTVLELAADVLYAGLNSAAATANDPSRTDRRDDEADPDG